MITIKEPGRFTHIKAWTDGVEFEPQAEEQLRQTARLPVVWPHVAVMPDVHLGIGATVGSVIPTLGAIIPAAVGVDIGCGMVAVRTNLSAEDIEGKHHDLYLAICKAVPHGGAKNDKGVGSWASVPKLTRDYWDELSPKYTSIIEKYPKTEAKQAPSQLGTLGGGNHFVEVCLDESDRVWFMLHSGSRGVGNRIGSYFIERAKECAESHGWTLPHKDLAYLPEEHPDFDGYCDALMWAQRYAFKNRAIMMVHTMQAVRETLNIGVTAHEEAINCHHNYVSMETHFGQELYITRKGAVSARLGEMGIIPGSMGTRSFIVRGKGNVDSFHSCSHGAGRVMSRGIAKKSISLEDHARDTEGVVCSKDARVLDESPRAYKDIDAVMAAQSDLVEVVHTLKQVLCVKG